MLINPNYENVLCNLTLEILHRQILLKKYFCHKKYVQTNRWASFGLLPGYFRASFGRIFGFFRNLDFLDISGT